MNNSLIREILKGIPEERVRGNVPLAPFTTYRCGGPADWLILPEEEEEALLIGSRCTSAGMPLAVLGGGSNVLIGDRGIRGIVLVTRHLNRLTITRDGLTGGAGTPLRTVMKESLRNGLSGIEFLVGIPGTLGGATVMNAGLKKEWLSAGISHVVVCGPTGPETVAAATLPFGYRTSGLEKNLIITITLHLVSAPPDEVKERCAEYLRQRTATQPLTERSAGSVFKNPPGLSAGRIIDECGLKGYAMGDARVSERHANFIVNGGNASADDIRRVMAHVQETVARRRAVTLEPEIRFMGEF